MMIEVNGFIYFVTAGKRGATQTRMFFTVTRRLQTYTGTLMYAFLEGVSKSSEADALKVIDGAKAGKAFWRDRVSVVGIESLKAEHKDVDQGVTYLAPGNDEDDDLPASIAVVKDKISPAIRGFSVKLKVRTSQGYAFAKVPFLGAPPVLAEDTIHGTLHLLPTTDIDGVKSELSKLKKRGQFF